MRIIETHCHLDYLESEEDLSSILDKAQKVGVEKIVTIAVDPENLDKVLKIAEERENVYFTQGIHPHDAKSCTDEVYVKIRQRCDHPKMVAIGEIGLDYHYNHSPKEIQKTVFRKHLELAIEKQLPVVIHSRDADEDTMEILSYYQKDMTKKGVIHSFTSGEELAQTALNYGFHLGFNGIITFKSAENVRDIVRLTPLDRILVETDSPYLTPVPHRGKKNNPSYLPFIIEALASLKEVSSDELCEKTFQNAKSFFGI